MTRPVPQLITVLKNDAGVSAVVGTAVHAEHLPQDIAPPFVCLTVQNTRAWATISNCAVKAYSLTLSVDLICSSRSSAETLQEAIEDALAGYSSSDPSYPIEGVLVESGPRWDLVEPRDGSDERQYWCSQFFTVNYRRV